jgi:NAD dependent epimerase/dehydratase
LLVKNDFNVVALTQYNSFNNWGWLEDISCLEEIKVVSGDIRDSSFCRKIVQDIDQIIHLAALIAIPYSYHAPQSYVETNILGTLNLCEAVKDKAISKFVHVSTSEVYGTAKYVPIDENHPLQPQSPYSASKIGADAIAMSFKNSFEIPVSIARPFNVYGPRQSSRAVIPTIISQILAKKDQIDLGDVTPTRDFNFVKDTCTGLMKILESDKTIGKTINIGSNSEISIRELFEKICLIMNSNPELKESEDRLRPKNSEVFRLKCDNSEIKNLVNYQPNFSLEKGLKQTIDWFLDKENLKKYKSNIYNI